MPSLRVGRGGRSCPHSWAQGLDAGPGQAHTPQTLGARGYSWPSWLTCAGKPDSSMESLSCQQARQACALCAGMAGGREEERCHLLSCWAMGPGGQGGQRVQCVQPTTPRQHVLGGPRTLGTPASVASGPGNLQKSYPRRDLRPWVVWREIKAYPGPWLGKPRLGEATGLAVPWPGLGPKHQVQAWV